MIKDKRLRSCHERKAMMHESGDRMWSAMKVQTIGKYKGKWLKVDLRGGGAPGIVCVYIIYIYIDVQARDLCATMVHCIA